MVCDKKGLGRDVLRNFCLRETVVGRSCFWRYWKIVGSVLRRTTPAERWLPEFWKCLNKHAEIAQQNKLAIQKSGRNISTKLDSQNSFLLHLFFLVMSIPQTKIVNRDLKNTHREWKMQGSRNVFPYAYGESVCRIVSCRITVRWMKVRGTPIMCEDARGLNKTSADWIAQFLCVKSHVIADLSPI